MRVTRRLACALLVAGARVRALSPPPPAGIRLRRGFPDDDLALLTLMATERLIPARVSHEQNLIVAEDVRTGRRVGWAQLRSLGYAGVTTDPARFEDDDVAGKKSLRRRDVQSTLAIERDMDEEIWQEFEDDATDIPNGLASLPWTEEYRAASRAAAERLACREQRLALELAARPKLWELAPVHVLPDWRHRGIGSALVAAVLEGHVTTGQRGSEIYAVTRAGCVPWYTSNFGFVEETCVPKAMSLGWNVGRAVSKLSGGAPLEELVCLRVALQ